MNLVFASGFLLPQHLGKIEYFNKVRELAESKGHRAIFPPVKSLASTAERAASLAQFIQDDFPTGPIHIIAHSMGGLDSRVLIAADHPALAGRIVSLTTLSTPHHGSPLADLLVGERPSFFSGLFSGSFSFGLGSLYDAFRAGLETVGIDIGALKDLKEKGAEATPDVARTHGQITYRSYAGSGRAVDPRTSVVLRLGHKYILGHPDGGPNDGAVAVKSAEYGTFKGTWPCDHLDMVGHDLDKPGFAQGDFNHLAEFAKIMDLLQAEHPGT